MHLILRVVLARSSFSCVSCFCTGERRGSISSSNAAIPFEHKQALRAQRAKIEDSVGQVSVEKNKPQLLSGIFCKQQKFKTAPSCPNLFLPNAYSQWDSTEERCKSQFGFFSWILFLCNFSCPAFFVVQNSLLMLRVLQGRSRMAEHFTKKYKPAIFFKCCMSNQSLSPLASW